MTKNIKKTRCLKKHLKMHSFGELKLPSSQPTLMLRVGPIEGEVGGGLKGWEGVRSYPFGDLAQLYYPDHNYDSALRHFREEMHLTRGMWKAMVAEGYKENTKTLTRAQVRTIVQFLGEP